MISQPGTRVNGPEHAEAGTPPPIVVVGASAGGVEALTRVMRELPADLQGAVFVTMHFPSFSTSVLPRILTRAGRLPATHAEDNQPIVAGEVCVAPPDRHLLILRERIQIVRGPQEHGNRPAIDPMFRSASVAHGARVVGVILTGNLDDGTAGLLSIKRGGGFAIVQDPADALFPSMPASAMQHVDVDQLVPLERIARAIVAAVEAARERPMPQPREVA